MQRTRTPGARRRILLYGTSLILGSVGASLRAFPQFEVIPLYPPLPDAGELEAMEPDVVLFDIEAPHPDAAFTCLETCSGLLLVGMSPDGNVVRLWSGRQLHELATKDLMAVIDEQLEAAT